MKNFFIIFIFLLGLVDISFSMSYDDRTEKYRNQIQEEIQRKHELQLEKAKAEVYAKELLLQKADIDVSNSNYLRSVNHLKNSSKNFSQISF